MPKNNFYATLKIRSCFEQFFCCSNFKIILKFLLLPGFGPVCPQILTFSWVDHNLLSMVMKRARIGLVIEYSIGVI